MMNDRTASRSFEPIKTVPAAVHRDVRAGEVERCSLGLPVHLSREEQMDAYENTTAPHDEPSGAAAGWILFAGILMIMIGIFHALSGLAALIEDTFFVATPNYLLELDVTTWGWIHLIAGIVVALAGFGVFAGRTWARVVGITLAGVSAIANFAFIPYYPVWSLVIIALDIFVIWALAVHGRELAVD
jgi:hypothetical protein